MNRYFFLFLIICLLTNFSSQAQAIRGGEIWTQVTLVVYAQTRVHIYRQDTGGASSILFNWGDGTIETLQGYTALTPVPGIVVDIYIGSHAYDGPGTYALSTVDSFLIEDIVNIPNSGSQPLVLHDTLVLPETPFNHWSVPLFANTPTKVDVDDDGVFHHSTSLVLIAGSFYDSTTLSLIPFPAEGYTFPDATNALSCCPFIWDRPIAPGRYAFSIKARSWYEGEIAATSTRNMIIDVDSSMIISTLPWSWIDEGIISLYPNPASDQVQLQLGGFHAPVQVRIFDALGRMMYERHAIASQLETLQIPVSDWPQGIYQVQIQSGGKTLTRQVAVQR